MIEANCKVFIDEMMYILYYILHLHLVALDSHQLKDKNIVCQWHRDEWWDWRTGEIAGGMLWWIIGQMGGGEGRVEGGGGNGLALTSTSKYFN